MCHIDKDSYILDVGCGVGITACYIAKEYGCKVVGIDISETMVKRSKERAKRKGVEDKVEFRVADAQDLPFKDNLFDAVVSESVNAFIEDKQKAVNEYKRVLKPGGYVGFNEVTWVETPPPELVEYMSRALGGAEFLTPGGWKDLLEGARLTDIVARTYKTTAWRQWANEVKHRWLRSPHTLGKILRSKRCHHSVCNQSKNHDCQREQSSQGFLICTHPKSQLKSLL